MLATAPESTGWHYSATIRPAMHTGRTSPLASLFSMPAKGCGDETIVLRGRPKCAMHSCRTPGDGDAAGVSSAAMNWLEPVIGVIARGGRVASRTLIDPGQSGWEVPAMFERDGALFVRLFNTSGDDASRDLVIGFDAGKVELVELDGRSIEELKPRVDDAGRRTVRLSMPRFGIRTLRFSNVRAPRAGASGGAGQF